MPGITATSILLAQFGVFVVGERVRHGRVTGSLWRAMNAFLVGLLVGSRWGRTVSSVFVRLTHSSSMRAERVLVRVAAADRQNAPPDDPIGDRDLSPGVLSG